MLGYGGDVLMIMHAIRSHQIIDLSGGWALNLREIASLMCQMTHHTCDSVVL